MAWASLGSLSLPFHLQRHSVSTRAQIAKHGLEVTTGTAASPSRHLRGDLAPLSAIEDRSMRIDRYLETTRLAAVETIAVQTALQRISDTGSETAVKMLAVSTAGVGEDSLRAAGIAARASLADMVATLSGAVAGRALFSGAAVDRGPLISVEAMISALAPSLAGLETADAIVAAVDSAFLDPGGLFETVFYQGGPAVPGAMIDEMQSVEAPPTVADPSLRRMLADMTKAALVGDATLTISAGQRRALARSGAEALMQSNQGVTATQASLGDMQSRLDRNGVRLTSERDALTLARQDLVGVDPYEAASRLEEAQTRLELLYAITARTARLSLTEYL